MSPYLAGLLTGLGAGSLGTVFALALCRAARDADDASEAMRERRAAERESADIISLAEYAESNPTLYLRRN